MYTHQPQSKAVTREWQPLSCTIAHPDSHQLRTVSFFFMALICIGGLSADPEGDRPTGKSAVSPDGQSRARCEKGRRDRIVWGVQTE